MKAKVKATGKIVDGIPIYYGSEGKGYLDVPVDHDIFDRYDLEEVELLEQPSLPEGLEEAAEKYRRNSCNAALRPNVDGPTPEYGGSVKGAFIAGAEWMKTKILEWAEKRYQQTISNVGCYTGHSVWAEIIEKIKSL